MSETLARGPLGRLIAVGLLAGTAAVSWWAGRSVHAPIPQISAAVLGLVAAVAAVGATLMPSEIARFDRGALCFYRRSRLRRVQLRQTAVVELRASAAGGIMGSCLVKYADGSSQIVNIGPIARTRLERFAAAVNEQLDAQSR